MEPIDLVEKHAEINKVGGIITKFYYCPYLKGAKIKKYDKEEIFEMYFNKILIC